MTRMKPEHHFMAWLGIGYTIAMYSFGLFLWRTVGLNAALPPFILGSMQGPLWLYSDYREDYERKREPVLEQFEQ